ncbi:YeiH family protein [Brevibacterium litoralis]|uniref:YeiH family protein n=1 Tax=Brevibacterium litoralis TaxID=3138935 RepID=UPI0032EFDFA6
MSRTSTHVLASTPADRVRSSATGTAGSWSRIRRTVPGLAVVGLATALCMTLQALLGGVLPFLSAVLLAILGGILVRNLCPPLPAALGPGVDVAAKPLLRTGVVLLGAQLALGQVLDLGWGVVVLAVLVVVAGFLAAWGCGRALGVDRDLSLLIGAGFSICGAAAVAGAQTVVRAGKEHVATAVALVVLSGTAMIALVPALAGLLGLEGGRAGVLAGAATHEVAQVVAIGALLTDAAGGGPGPGGTDLADSALDAAVLTKLTRALLLAPVVAVLGLVLSRAVGLGPARDGRRQGVMRGQDRMHGQGASAAGTRETAPPLVPLWVLLFLAVAGLRTLGLLPGWAVDLAALGQTVCLTAAMFALGLGVSARSLRTTGFRPLVLALLVTAVVTAVATAGALLLV